MTNQCKSQTPMQDRPQIAERQGGEGRKINAGLPFPPRYTKRRAAARKEREGPGGAKKEEVNGPKKQICATQHLPKEKRQEERQQDDVPSNWGEAGVGKVAQ